MATQNTEALSTLKGMFPDVDPEVCEAVFEANQANLEQSINALLSMSDPNYKSEETIPVQTESGYNSREQIRRDEELARSLAAEADRQFYAENPQYDAQQQRQRQQSPPQQQQSAFPDFSEELPIIKEKVVQAFDTTKKKAKEWYDKIKQQTATRNETTQHSTPHYTSLPGYEADNPLLEEDFSPLQPRKNNDLYGSHGIDVNKDTDDDVFSSSTNNHQIKIIREEHNQSPINTTSKASPYKLNDDFEIPVNNNNNNSTSTTTSSTSPERYDSQKATSADAEEIKKI
ncbi:CUE domain protein, putative [Rhizophagus clarus]|uniref:CUE domain protein, putative n=1 Tax=Rhizophagus clarus TaxID=94130 RepID=A0A8H3LJI5_9GLOM|nr:CUE domain protein, putative [Rhizophagus clarus]